ncbi:TonB-dependent receptor [Massilia sp. TS11]|uniref:TonB-dependent receptor n=1 Tax=Massilia sp. TS11 TaxID=2908003 RepID=UPI001EDB2BB1|nr:TonB-dependent receptor [Massilia sp. TS11]MCG2586291.1 TonB-dependent receptor [Massilia sp. TS11]
MRFSAPPARRRAGTPIQVAILTLLAGMHAAHAQQTGAPAAKADPNAIPEVVVTGTKVATSLQKTPVAITALNAAALDDAHVQTIQDVVALVPSFQATGQGDHGVITMTMRGIGNDSAKTEYADPEVAIFVDGVYAPRPEGATALLFDLEAIEVMRGPQGTLWGRNSTVGAVNMQTVKPVLGQTTASLQGGMGDYARFGVRAAMNIPTGDSSALRIALVHEQHDGYVKYQTFNAPSLDAQKAAYLASGGTAASFQPINPNQFVTNGPRYNAQDQSGVRLSWLYQPNPGLKWNISYERFQDRGTPSMNLMQTPRAGQDAWSALIDTAPALHRDVNAIRSRVDYALSPDVALAYVAGISRFSGSSTYDQDGGREAPTSFSSGATFQANNTVYSHYASQSHELNLNSVGQREIDWQLGLYYAAEKNDIRFDIPIMNGTQQGSVAWQGSFIQPKETVDSRAVFGQATWNLSRDSHLTGGLRYTSDKRTNEGGNGYTWNYDSKVPQVPLSASIDPTKPGQGYNPGKPSNDGRYSGSKMTGLLRFSQDLDRNNMIYASVSTGFKAGGLQDGGRTYGAETLTNYEIGSKSTLLGGALRINTALYSENFKDFQFSAPVTNPDGSHSFVTSNVDGAKVHGVEAEIAAKLSAEDKLQLALSYTHSRLGALIAGSNDYALPFCPALNINCVDVTGHTMPHAPTFSAQILYQHTFRLGDGSSLTPRISTHYETKSELSVFNLGPNDQQAAYTRTDIGLRYQGAKQFWIDAYVRNVGDGRVKTSAMNGSNVWVAQYLPPRTIGINAGIDF